jgi:hypothetical protein
MDGPSVDPVAPAAAVERIIGGSTGSPRVLRRWSGLRRGDARWLTLATGEDTGWWGEGQRRG